MRSSPWLVPALSLALSVCARGAPAEDEALTDKVRAEAQKQVDLINKGEGDVTVPRRALVKMGPVVWPVVENALKLLPPDAARPHFSLVKAMIAKKAEPEFEAFRDRLRRRYLMDDWKGVVNEFATFRLGLPDPAQKGKRLPLSIKPTMVGAVAVYRSGDASIVLAFGPDADEKKPDCVEVSMTDGTAGFVGALGGKAVPYERTSGKGSDVTAIASSGFAWAWATDGAIGKAPGGTGGTGGVASANGAAGQFTRNGDGGAGAPAK